MKGRGEQNGVIGGLRGQGYKGGDTGGIGGGGGNVKGGEERYSEVMGVGE